MKRLTLFLKGNLDVHDALHSCRVGGRVVWNGINDVLRERHPEWTARVKHETMSRLDAVLAASGTVPASIAERDLALGSYPAAMQFSRAVFESDADVIVLSILGEVGTDLVRSRSDGSLFFPRESERWAENDQAWLSAEFEPVPRLDAETSMANLSTVIGRIRQHGEAPIVIFNMSPIVPGETIRCYQGIDDAYSTRVRRWNLGLIDVSAATGVSIVDVDTVLARAGADALKLDMMHLTPQGYRLVAEETVNVLEDLGVLED